MKPETADQFVCRLLAEQGLVAAPWQRKLMAACIERETEPVFTVKRPAPLFQWKPF